MKISLQERFWGKVDKSGGHDSCWVWTAAKIKGKNYGKFSVATSVWNLAHVVSWRLANGQIPTGLCVLHRCDNPQCVNPKHLFLGTLADNNRDMKFKDRHQRGERQWMAKLTDEDVIAIRAAKKRGSIQAEIAREYAVSASTISQIVLEKNWKHLL